jgi:signal peptidase II
MKKVAIIFSLVFALDRVTKYLVVRLMPYGSEIRLIGDYVKITHVRNPNSLWSLSLGQNFPYIIVGILAIVFLSVLIRDALKTKHTKNANVYSLILSGVAGNIVDRIHFKEVVDFIDVGISPSLRWPVFNVADSAISIGLVIYFIMVLREYFSKRSEK